MISSLRGMWGTGIQRFGGLYTHYVLVWQLTDSGDQELGSTRGVNFMLVARTEVLRDVTT